MGPGVGPALLPPGPRQPTDAEEEGPGAAQGWSMLGTASRGFRRPLFTGIGIEWCFLENVLSEMTCW